MTIESNPDPFAGARVLPREASVRITLLFLAIFLIGSLALWNGCLGYNHSHRVNEASVLEPSGLSDAHRDRNETHLSDRRTPPNGRPPADARSARAQPRGRHEPLRDPAGAP